MFTNVLRPFLARHQIFLCPNFCSVKPDFSCIGFYINSFAVCPNAIVPTLPANVAEMPIITYASVDPTALVSQPASQSVSQPVSQSVSPVNQSLHIREEQQRPRAQRANGYIAFPHQFIPRRLCSPARTQRGLGQTAVAIWISNAKLVSQIRMRGPVRELYSKAYIVERLSVSNYFLLRLSERHCADVASQWCRDAHHYLCKRGTHRTTHGIG